MPNFRSKNKSNFVDVELAKLSEQQWEELYQRLRLFTYKYYGRLAAKSSILEDMIQDSIFDACYGKRNRPPDVSVVKFIWGIIRSNTSHYFEKESRRANFKAKFILLADSSKDHVKNEDLKLDLSSAMKKIGAEVKNDKELSIIHQSVVNNHEIKANEIAENTSLPVRQIKNAKKRYVRVARKYLDVQVRGAK